MHWPRGWSCTDHVPDHTVITRLHMHWHVADHALIMKLIIHWSPDCACTHHVADDTVITWLTMHWSHSYHALNPWLSCTDPMADHALITWLCARTATSSVHAQSRDQCMIATWSVRAQSHDHRLSVTDHGLINTWSVHDEPRYQAPYSHFISACAVTWSVHVVLIAKDISWSNNLRFLKIFIPI